jgi:hypothetical protein
VQHLVLFGAFDDYQLDIHFPQHTARFRGRNPNEKTNPRDVARGFVFSSKPFDQQ